MKLAFGIGIFAIGAYLLIDSQMMLWGDTKHLKAEELLLAKVWSAGGAILLAVGLGLALSSRRR